jgi:hypothetical protein
MANDKKHIENGMVQAALTELYDTPDDFDIGTTRGVKARSRPVL